MRTFLFFISLASLLFWGEISRANEYTHLKDQPSTHIVTHNQLKSTDTNFLWTIDEDSFDSTEEFHLGDKTKEKIASLTANGKHFSCFQTHNIPLFISDFCHAAYTTAPFRGYSSPIYITHRVLRI